MATISEAMAIALGHHQGGRLQVAEQIYRQILAIAPNQVDALHLLGVLAHQAGKHEVAVEYIERAIELKADEHAFHCNLGEAYRALGKASEAAACYRRALKLNPNYAEAYNNLGLALQGQERTDEVVACFRRAIGLRPHFAEAYYNWGVVAGGQGKLEEAVVCFRRATDLKPDYAEAYNNLGLVLREQRKLEEAVACYRRAVDLKPDNAEAHNNLAIALNDLGDLEQAVGCCRRALELKPDFAEAHNNLGNALKDQGKLDEAITCFQQLLELKPDYATAHSNLGNLLRLRERHADARRAYENALRLNPDRDLLRLSIATICPAVFESSAAIDEYRAGLLAQVECLAEGKFDFDISQIEVSTVEPPYNLQYHGRDDRPIKEAWAKLFRNLPIQETARGSSPRPKLGLVVTRGHEAIFLRWCTELLRRMQPKGWEIVVICPRAGMPQVRTALNGSRIQLLPVCGSLEQIINTVGEAHFDVLCHWETGSDSTNYFLPYFCLAAVQCNLAGIQSTSGIPQMDYYLSSEFIEAEGAEAHYSEKLLRARSLLGYHIRPSLPTVKSREAFGFRAGQHLYVCPQNLRKFHPDFDLLLAGILQTDPAGVVVIVEDSGMCLSPRLRGRFAKTIPDVLDRVVFLPHQSYADYLSLVAAADVILDPLYYSGGTTTLEAFSLGKVIVTWPSQFQIGRGVLASYRKMGIAGFMAAAAAEYVRMAVALGTDAERRRAAEREILAASGELFEDMGAVKEYQRIFDRLVEEARNHEGRR